jgi:hypothetical protein
MNRFLLALGLFISFSASLLAQDVTKEAKRLQDSSKVALARLGTIEQAFWDKGASGNFLLNQSSLSNWQAGGQSSLSGAINLGFYANHYSKKWRWANRLDLGYGRQWQSGLDVKTDDRIELNSRLDRLLSKNWSVSANLTFRTQFTEGFEKPEDSVPISNFLAPAYTLAGLGFTYSPSASFSVFMSPATVKHTYVNDQRLADQGAYGLEGAELNSEGVAIAGSASKNRLEIGAYINAYYKQKLMENIQFESKLDLYSNYLNNPQNIDVNWENVFMMKVNRYVTVNLVLHLIYDDDIKFTDSEGTGPRTQFRQSLGLGLSYSL